MSVVALERLTALDATFLELEEADPTAHMHIGSALRFRVPSRRDVPRIDALREHLAARLGLLPRYRHRLSSTTTGGITWPMWEPDEHFDLAGHVRHARLPRPGGERELLDWLEDFWSQRLDRARPLWEMVLLDGLPEGRWVLATKTHHCLVDGVGSVDVGNVLLDTAPEPSALPEVPAWTPAPEPHPHLGPVVGGAVDAVRAGVSAGLHPRRSLERGRALAELLLRDEVVPAPHCSLNVPISGHRREAVLRTSLAELKAIAHAWGGTVNDASLAAVTGGLRALLLSRGEEPPRGLRAMVPVNLRLADETFALGNKLTSLFVELPVDEPDAIALHCRVRETTERLKSGNQALGGRTLVEVAAAAPPVLHTFVARALFASRLFNITITNVPGVQRPLYALGSLMEDVIPLVPLAAEHALGVAIVSYDGKVTFGINADRETMPDLDVFVAGVEDTLEELKP